MVQIDDGALRFGIRISLCYLIVFLFAIVSQTYRKFEQMFKIKKEGKRFVRWDPTNAAMMAADRAVGNCMEWGPVFLILIWCNILAGEAPDTIAFSAWLWLAARGTCRSTGVEPTFPADWNVTMGGHTVQLSSRWRKRLTKLKQQGLDMRCTSAIPPHERLSRAALLIQHTCQG
eukprot:3018448-Rhodomonas_salina.2